jgi:hypothetical protein
VPTRFTSGKSPGPATRITSPGSVIVNANREVPDDGTSAPAAPNQNLHLVGSPGEGADPLAEQLPLEVGLRDAVGGAQHG